MAAAASARVPSLAHSLAPARVRRSLLGCAAPEGVVSETEAEKKEEAKALKVNPPNGTED